MNLRIDKAIVWSTATRANATAEGNKTQIIKWKSYLRQMHYLHY